MIKFEFTYKLLKPVTINQNQEIKSLVFNAPTIAQKQDAAKIKQFVMTALRKNNEQNQSSKNNEESDDSSQSKEYSEEEKAYSLGSVIYSVESADIVSILSIFENLITSKNSCIMNNSQPLNSTIFKEFLTIDVDRMLGAYISNFIIASL